ncbi:cytokine-inducible SH2-containing protein-like [Salvelinus fontinalis]|uniref:Cytokine-inducible SH2-containing protein n=1 Tax=Salvelinus namaycush TaxID=8040 RepID=A0A8U1H782_SALNM|nr:cytokine-inducible SH2-containing protein-like [Salvelinus namaycush]XP_055726110.1 cytokine-inducible SH2-containing protein-like [Salvelinus fontinalis]
MISCVQRALLRGPPSDMIARMMSSMQQNYGERGDLCCQNPTAPLYDPTEDLCCITTTFQYLQNSGWYWGSISAREARDALLKVSVGTFLVRDSSHPLYMLTLSVKTACGPTNVRIEYSGGHFRLDSSSPGPPHLLSFPDVCSLVQHYVGSGQTQQGKRVESEGPPKPNAKPSPSQPSAKDNAVLLKLMRPLPQAFPSLQHLTRLTINCQIDCIDQLPLPRPLVRYLQDYPFQV